MSRRYQAKTRTLESVSTGKESNTKLYNAAIFRVSTKNTIQFHKAGIFLLNPASYEEHKPANWSRHSVPGQSDPIMQWVSGGEHTISFDVLVSKDTVHFDPSDQGDLLDSLAGKALNIVGDVASSFFNVAVPPLANLFGGPSQGDGEELSITPQLNYYRQLLYPKNTANGNKLASSPPLVVLYAGKTFSQFLPALSNSGGGLSTIGRDSQLDPSVETYVVTDLRIRITKQLPNLTPMEAIVSFTLTEYIRQSKSSDTYGNTDVPDDVSSGGLLDNIGGLF